jgi:hypothetical protein
MNLNDLALRLANRAVFTLLKQVDRDRLARDMTPDEMAA